MSETVCYTKEEVSYTAAQNDDGKNCWIMNAVAKTKSFSPCPLIVSARKTKIASFTNLF